VTGRFIAIVGPSGVGKDSVMQALAARNPQFELARRVITRPSDAGGEEFDGVTEAEFAALRDRTAFALYWQAHGLHYAIPASVDAHLAEGRDVIANLSRSVLSEAKSRFARCEVIHLVASPEALAARLTGRGRETAEDIEQRLKRADHALPDGVDARTFDNSHDLTDCVDAIMAYLTPVRAI
jgi:ribose 1,5-bisphosphokinase